MYNQEKTLIINCFLSDIEETFHSMGLSFCKPQVLQKIILSIWI